MKIEANGNEQIKVALSEADMNALDITYEEMDYANIETRRVIWTILDEARQSLGKPIDTDGKLLIEVAPANDGGCVLCFTAMPDGTKAQKRMIMKKDAEPLLFRAADGDSFLDALGLLKKSGDRLKSYNAYSFGGKYFLILFPELTCSPYWTYLLSEYGEVCVRPREELSAVFEYGKQLV